MVHALRSRRVVTPQGELDATVVIEDEIITAVHKNSDLEPATRNLPTEDLGSLALLPGLIDAHTHINEPGRTEWEGFRTATLAAAAGGFTTLVDMPLNCLPETTDPAALELKRDAARGKCMVDVAFWGGCVDGNQHQIEPLALAGVAGFKSFLIYPGCDGFTAIDRENLRPRAASYRPHRAAAAGPRRTRTLHHRCRRAPQRHWRRLAQVLHLPRLAPRPGRARSHRHAHRPLPRVPLPPAHRPPLHRAGAAHARRRQSRRPAAQRRDLPALPALLRGGDPRQHHALQVRARHPQRAPTATSSGTHCNPASSTSSPPTTRPARRTSNACACSTSARPNPARSPAASTRPGAASPRSPSRSP